MAESVLKSRTLASIYGEIRDVYLGDSRPWILGFSGGKDSTCMVQMVWRALEGLPPDKLSKRLFVISSDTQVESPAIVEQVSRTLGMMEKAAAGRRLPLSAHMVRPLVEDTFWVCLLGRGYPAPTNLFRWCTDRLKIRNADRFIKQCVSEYGEAVIVMGTRKDESGSRQQLMNLYEIEGSALSRHSKLAQTYVYTPLRDFTQEDVWNYLLQNANPWGSNNRDLLSMYQAGNAAECPLVVDTSTPSCGGGRFGCWTCTVVEDDLSLRSLVEGGEDWMEPLLDLRDELKETQNPARRREVRQLRRKDGRMKLIADSHRAKFEENLRESGVEVGGGSGGVEGGADPYESLVPGPYTLEFCAGFLERLLRAQAAVRERGPDPGMQLIREEEVHEIQRIWRAERGDWRDTAYGIYERVTGERLGRRRDDLGGFGALEQDLLEGACRRHGVPPLLVSRLLGAEHESQGMARHSGVYRKINSILSEEWREDMSEIIADLEGQKAAKKGGARA